MKKKKIEDLPSLRVARDLIARGWKVSSDDQYLIAKKGKKKWIIKVVETPDENLDKQFALFGAVKG